MAKAFGSYPKDHLFKSGMCYQRRREAVDNGYFDNQEVKIIVCNTMYVGSNPTRFLNRNNATVSIFSRRLMGLWPSWLRLSAHNRMIVGSSPTSPTNGVITLKPPVSFFH